MEREIHKSMQIRGTNNINEWNNEEQKDTKSNGMFWNIRVALQIALRVALQMHFTCISSSTSSCTSLQVALQVVALQVALQVARASTSLFIFSVYR